MAFLGDYNPSDIVYFKFTTLDISASPAVPFALASGVVSIYKDDNTTQSTAGVTLTTSFDGMAGANNVKIDTAADGSFYAAGHFFQAILTSGTVNGVTVVAYVLDSWTIGKQTALKPTVAGRPLDVSATGEAGIDWANVGSPTTTVNLSGTTISTASAPTAAAIRIEMDANSTRLAAIDLRGSRTTVRGTVSGTGASITQFTCATLAIPGVTLNQFVPRILVFDIDTLTAGLRGATTDIRTSSVATLPTFTYTAITAVPQTGDSFTIE